MVIINTEPTIDALKQPTILKVIRAMASTIDANTKKLEDGYNNLPDTEQITTDIVTVKSDIANLKTKDTSLQTQINDNKAGITANTADIATHTEEITALTKELLDELLLSKVGNGIQLRFVKEDGDYVDSNVLTTATPTTARLLPGTTDRTFKLSIDLADGTSVVTNDFVIPEGGGTEVVVTGITIQAGEEDNSFNVAIQLSDGTPITSNDWVINIPAVTVDIVQNASGISINGTALQSATTARPGLMTPALVSSLNNVNDTVNDQTTILGEQATAITNLNEQMTDVVEAIPETFNGMAITESATGVTIEMSKSDGMTSVSETIPIATTEVSGVMSPTDKAKLDSVGGSSFLSDYDWIQVTIGWSGSGIASLIGADEYDVLYFTIDSDNPLNNQSFADIVDLQPLKDAMAKGEKYMYMGKILTRKSLGQIVVHYNVATDPVFNYPIIYAVSNPVFTTYGLPTYTYESGSETYSVNHNIMVLGGTKKA